MRFAPCFLLLGPFVLYFFPWIDDFSGFAISNGILHNYPTNPDVLLIAAAVLIAVQPLCLLVGIVFAVDVPSSRRAGRVGASILIPFIGLTFIQLYTLIQFPRGLKDLTVFFYLSHAATLACIVLCVCEHRRMS